MTDSSVESSGGAGQTSVSLLVRVKARDPAAWQRFVDLYSPLVFHWCCRAGLQHADAADVGQEVFRTVAGSIGGFVHGRDRGTFRGWLRTVTRTRILDFRRRQKRIFPGIGGSEAQEKFVELPDSWVDEDDPSDEDDKLLVVRRAVELVLGNCKDMTRQAFLRVMVEGQQPADVARELGMTLNAVYLAKSHVLHRIREELGEFVEL